VKENINLPLFYGASIEIFRRAEILRNHMTEAEQLLWNKLNHKQLNGYRFRRQHPINQFIVDFYCHRAKLVIELDGEIHLKEEVAERDQGREAMIRNFGIEILRFRNQDVKENIDKVLLAIKHKLSESAPNP